MGAADIAKQVEEAIELIKPFVADIPDLPLRVAAETVLSLIAEGLKVATEAGLMTQDEGDAEQVRALVKAHIQQNWQAAIRARFGG